MTSARGQKPSDVQVESAGFGDGRTALNHWFRSQGWAPFPFQIETWDGYAAGRDGLVHAPTGNGKTYSVFLGPVEDWINRHGNTPWTDQTPLEVLWITPLRALANDTVQSLQKPITGLGLPWSVGLRTGDVTSSAKARQRHRLPTVLVTTPESLSVLLSYTGLEEQWAALRCIIVDEWHELLGTKRGVQCELGMARLRQLAPEARVWGLSATLGNLAEAARVLCGSASAYPDMPLLIGADLEKTTEIVTVFPDTMERFPWVGHLGIRLLPQVIELISAAKTTLLFTNVRSQAETWYRCMLAAMPEWESEIGLHHGSLDRHVREEVEARLSAGTIRCVVCTSSLDLGVDFAPVEQVIQIGSPKGVARLLQRAGRSGHSPGRISRIYCVPTHAFELVEYAAARDAVAARRIETRAPLERPLDLLVQHLVTVALGTGFRYDAMLAEVRASHAYRDLTEEEWLWCIEFVSRGGRALGAYPQFCRVTEVDGTYRVINRTVEKYHRLSIGTITSDASINISLPGTGVLGTVEESFIARLAPGNKFVFAGRMLELVRVKDMTAVVRLAKSQTGLIPRWAGSRMPLSSELAAAVRHRLRGAAQGLAEGNEMKAVMPVLEVQARWSAIPTTDELLIESMQTRDGYHLFVYPFEGRLVHEGLGALCAHRLSLAMPRTVTVMVNDYGFELLSDLPLPDDEETWRGLLQADNLLGDLLECLNSGELARRQFREVARVAGLLFSGYPGSQKSTRQIQASSGLLYDVLDRFDPDNLLIDQARREVLQRQLEVVRLQDTLQRLSKLSIKVCRPKGLTPLAFPIWASRVETQVSSERWDERIKRMALILDETADGPADNALAAAEASVPDEEWTGALAMDSSAKKRAQNRQTRQRRRRW